MSATIHYLRPFEREDVAPELAEADPAPDDVQEAEAEAPQPEKKRAWRRAMPCGRKSRFKKRMDGSVVPREER